MTGRIIVSSDKGIAHVIKDLSTPLASRVASYRGLELALECSKLSTQAWSQNLPVRLMRVVMPWVASTCWSLMAAYGLPRSEGGQESGPWESGSLAPSCGHVRLAPSPGQQKCSGCINLHRPRTMHMRKSDLMMANRIGGICEGMWESDGRKR